MMLKRIISLILLLTLMLQVLPVKQVGAVLFSNQINEEIPHTDTCKDIFKKQITLTEYEISAGTGIHSSVINNSKKFISYSSEVPCNHSLEILVPPPNIA
jgi:hypothetical protein